MVERTFSVIIHFNKKPPKKNKSHRFYRNPICLAKEYQNIINSGKAKNQSGLARKLGISRVRVNQIVTLLKLDRSVIKILEEIGDPMLKRYISERKLRSIVKMPFERQKAIIQSAIPIAKSEKPNFNNKILFY